MIQEKKISCSGEKVEEAKDKQRKKKKKNYVEKKKIKK